MSDPLEKYRRKRDPGATNEPFGAEQTVRHDSPAWSGRFVIHQHAASRMHFDLRLQIAGKLESFAVPKGLSLDPEVKHLAVHTESHPLEYLLFEDVIPEKNYGAGAMIVWDTGSFVFNEADGDASLARGKLDFTLNGFKVKGRFALIATGRRKAAQGLAGTSAKVSEWLLIKKRDQHAEEGSSLVERQPHSVVSGLTVVELKDKENLSEQLLAQARALSASAPPTKGKRVSEHALVPMVVQHDDMPKSSSQYLYELKLDGVRIIAEKEGQAVSLHYRSGRSCTRNYADIARCLQYLPAKSCVIDGEIVTFDPQGRPNFGMLASRIQARNPADFDRAQADVPVVFFAFDLLRLGDADLCNVALEQRKALLKKLVRGAGYVRTLDHIVKHGDALWSLIEAQDLEGMVAKKLGTPYVPGPSGTGYWVKIKRAVDHDYVVIGYSQSERGELKALLVATSSAQGLIYRGRVGTGFSNSDRIALTQLLMQLRSDKLAAEVPTSIRAVFVEPRLVIKVKHQGFSNNGHLRAASYRGIHESKQPSECTDANSSISSDAEAEEELLLAKTRTSTDSERWSILEQNSQVQMTNLEKVYFPEDGYTKGDLLKYYAEIAPVMLPHLKGRPVVLVRYPDGIHGKNFYQWRAPEKTPGWLRTFELYDEEKQKEKGSNKSAFLVDSVDALLHIANLGCIPLHVLAGREGTAQHCDFLTIDFDIGDRPLTDGVRLALTLRQILDELGLSGFPKTSGQRGLHVLVPLGPGVTYQSAKILCELLGRIVLSHHPDLATMQRRIDKREDKVYIDTGQTGRSRTIVAPYSVRAYPGARVSTPLYWSEVHLALDPAMFTIETLPTRVRQHPDPMIGMLEERPDIKSVLNQLARWTERS